MMGPQFSNKLNSSFLLFLDHELLYRGEAYSNASSLFYDQPAAQDRNFGYYTYSSPYQGFVYDSSITGASVPTGLYVGGSFTPVGTNGLEAINYSRGEAYFSSVPAGTVSGDFSIKDYNIELTSVPETKILFETKYNLNPRTSQTATYNDPDERTLPIIFIKPRKSSSDEIAMGGFELSKDIYRLFVFTDNQFHLDATCSVIRDAVRKHFGHFELSEMPFNSLGGLIDNSFNYQSTVDSKQGQSLSRIDDVQVIHNSQDLFQRNTDKINIEIFTTIVDVTVSSFRYPRS